MFEWGMLRAIPNLLVANISESFHSKSNSIRVHARGIESCRAKKGFRKAEVLRFLKRKDDFKFVTCYCNEVLEATVRFVLPLNDGQIRWWHMYYMWYHMYLAE